MNLTQWLLFFIAVQIIHGAGTWKLYQSAGKQTWTAFVPFLNFWVLLKIIQKPWYWFPLVFVPVIQLIMIASIWVETLRYFGKNDYKSIFLTLGSLGFYFFYISYSEQPQYIANQEKLPHPAFKEWFTSLLFAVVAATFVHNYVMQPFVIPTSSLEKSLLVGDFLLVSKLHYGAKIPQTAVSFPMVHDTIPLLKVKSYFNKPQYPYWRLPGFQRIKNNDIVVFNWPADTVPYFFYRGPLSFNKPVDKKSNYVKRAVGIAGDTLEVRDGYVYINGKKNQLPDRARLQFSYIGKTKGAGLNTRELYEKYDITDPVQYINPEERTFAISAMPEDKHQAFKTHPNIAGIERFIREKGIRDEGVFPQDPAYDFNIDQFGPIWIPKQGESIALNADNIALYKRI
ncbi:MAG: signal peptidase I, partial [Flavobacteriaceae bacterium]|nr:signal peptidase I [Flavobacteriaceae bacterium]